MSFQDERYPEPADDEIVCHTPAFSIHVYGPGDELLHVIEREEHFTTRGEARRFAPAWLALHDAEQKGQGK